MDLKKVIADIPDFPKPGILFRDITPITEDPAAYRVAIDGLAGILEGCEFDSFAAVESRGFIVGGPLGLDMGKGMVLVRKKGKLPRETVEESYELEYGSAVIEVHTGCFKPGQKVIVIDDLLATGGTAAACGRLVRKCGAEVAGYLFLVELEDLNGRELLADAPVFSLVKYA